MSDSQAAEQSTEQQEEAEQEAQQEEAEQEAQQEEAEQEAQQQEAEQQEAEREPQEEAKQQEADSGQTASHPRSGQMTAEDVTDPGAVDADVDVDREEVEGILAIRQSVQATAHQLIGREFDAVSEIAPTDNGWRAVVEVVERRSVPDTQDVIGRYEIELDTGGTVHGYRRLDRYRRGDTASFEG